MQSKALFYQSIVALDRSVHASKRVVSSEQDLRFAQGSHLIPAVIDEFAMAAHRLPIVFAGSGEHLTPVFLVGRKPGENTMVDAEGTWLGSYVPAYLRRYPFMIGEVEDRGPIVCVDETSTLIGTEKGEALFTEDGETAYLEDRIVFLNEYLDAAKRTKQFCAALAEHDLLVSADISFNNENGSTSALHGLLIVDEQRFASLDDGAYLKLKSENIIAVIYAHLFSLRAVEQIREPTS
ncbi:SapC family protein [Methylobacterium sp. Leaf87]|uniref:SapC family protein n=1 Tax=Methylobacterium sp. Leaf87 TaxID=1736243 RepID=UPI000B241895|nr:SapC family protein [Methylobacterium sp. Leaf87]